ncbi:hypothetical protein I307_01964 [Cryptococcus deuterogattii 99/473]|uniref:Peptidase S9 prolyl oligopeptidase catalytic domain-containing protein n=1 Tax=Cryptococcus deuterogattii Ram5 TaxID=1296110 RepID=A0A0D0V638_9TREE|nr:hypothetical protein I313_03734 [Cryptococcus deuterogattii Ram5]KIR72122.1 hypothetical protein I310_04174 [Cryptococcus deuterogattii CA1014]KIR99951.1 hypothetical protein L804_02587 [Cryptococcus deuterogattii 2001/935-1]KIY58651.1 hypothetical protein I307_01964 [Cryptococcus deuterogattii 99/473]
MDFLGPYLFPNGEKTIESFVITGISLGENTGHVTWKLLHDDPRVQIGIPIIGLPFESFPVYLRARALSQGLKWEPPVYPPSLKSFIEPIRNPVEEQQKYGGKKILSMHGKEDRLVPYGKGERDLRQIEKWVEEDKGKGGVCAIDVQDNVGHVCSIQMLKKAVEWTWIPELPEGREEGDEDMKFPTPDDMTVWKDEYLTDDHHAPERETYHNMKC